MMSSCILSTWLLFKCQKRSVLPYVFGIGFQSYMDFYYLKKKCLVGLCKGIFWGSMTCSTKFLCSKKFNAIYLLRQRSLMGTLGNKLSLFLDIFVLSPKIRRFKCGIKICMS